MSKLKSVRRVGLSATTAGVAAALMSVMALVAALATGGRGGDLLWVAERIGLGGERIAQDLRTVVEDRFAPVGFVVGAIHLQGATKASQDEILRAAAVPPGAPLLGLDLEAIRHRVEQSGWVARARVIRLLPDTLVIAVEERPLMAVWQVGGHRYVVASDGRPVTAVRPENFQTLPVIIGQGANTAAAMLLPELSRRPRLLARLQAVRRVDQRRWDLLLKSNGVILLPADDEASALNRLDTLDRKVGVLDLNLARIDLRSTSFTVVRPVTAAPPPSVSHGV